MSRVALALLVMFLIGCGGPSAKVTGRVTCLGKPVVGIIIFSPKGEAGGMSATATLDDDGRYELRLSTIGKHAVGITPRDAIANPKAGQLSYPCDLSPLERDVKAGDNDFPIDLAKRTR